MRELRVSPPHSVSPLPVRHGGCEAPAPLTDLSRRRTRSQLRVDKLSHSHALLLLSNSSAVSENSHSDLRSCASSSVRKRKISIESCCCSIQSPMAARALTAAARRVAGGRTGPPLLASCRNGASMNHCYSASAQPQREEEERGGGAGMTTGEQVEAAMNSQNVEVLEGEEHVATVLSDETINIGGAGEEASWVPDQETGVFGPADADTVTAATHGPPGTAAAMPTEGGSVLDQTVFVREEEMEDVERPAIDMANASSKKY